jgi:type IV pilus assembly protein PilO
MEKLTERIAGARPALKIAVIAAIAVAVTALNYLVVAVPTFGAPISEIERKIEAVRRDQQKLDQEYGEKTAIANNLNQFRREKELLEERLREALAELPNDKRIDELLVQLQDRATRAGIEILTIEPQPQVVEGFYARIPIPMSVVGDYHEIATFLDGVGHLQRIVNVNNIVFENARNQNGRIVLGARFLATTFMFVDPATQKAPAGAGK